jgi:hypothetical protein
MNKSNHIIFNKTIKPIENFKELLDKPFHEFYINTSHNSYIPCNQNGDVASSEAIKRTLGMGARVIELDCFARKNTGTTKEDLEPNDRFLKNSILISLANSQDVKKEILNRKISWQEDFDLVRKLFCFLQHLFYLLSIYHLY